MNSSPLGEPLWLVLAMANSECIQGTYHIHMFNLVCVCVSLQCAQRTKRERERELKRETEREKFIGIE